MKLDAIRFCIGPWKGRYSSMWRVWSPPSSDDLYLGARCLLQNLKISLHKSGKFRAAYVEDYYETVISKGRSAEGDRAFMKWDKIAVPAGTIMQALDIHFPLDGLSVAEVHTPKKGKKQFVLTPDDAAVGDNDTVTVKVLFHTAHPESEHIVREFSKRSLLLVFWVELSNGEYVSFAFCYTKQLPISLQSEHAKGIGLRMRDHLRSIGESVGAKRTNLTMQLFQMGLPPAITNIGNLNFHWVAESQMRITSGDGR